MVRSLTTMLLAAALALSPLLASAQGLTDAEQREMRTYRLTMPRIKQLMQVYTILGRSLQNDPRLQRMSTLKAEYEALQDQDDLSAADQQRLDRLEAELERLDEEFERGPGAALNMSGAQSLDAMARTVESSPLVTAAVKQAGLTPREFATLQLVLVQTMLAHGFVKAGTLKELPSEVNPENVTFIQEHEAEIQALGKELDALGAKQ
jgi:hypothetical protein